MQLSATDDGVLNTTIWRTFDLARIEARANHPDYRKLILDHLGAVRGRPEDTTELKLRDARPVGRRR